MSTHTNGLTQEDQELEASTVQTSLGYMKVPKTWAVPSSLIFKPYSYPTLAYSLVS